jgi:hypothetical protein
MYHVWFDLPENSLEAEEQLRVIAEPGRLLSTSPLDSLYARREQAVFLLMSSPFQPEIKDLVVGFSKRGQETMVMRGIVSGKVQDAHGAKKLLRNPKLRIAYYVSSLFC